MPNTELETFKIKMKICKLEILQDINAVKIENIRDRELTTKEIDVICGVLDKIAGLVEMNFNCRGL